MLEKYITLVLTGDELVQGDISDTTAHYFSKTLSDLGASIHQHYFVSDKPEMIEKTLQAALSNAHAIIITGGLGPTTDDRTRFALAHVLEQTLQFSEVVWDHIVSRLQRYGLQASENNRQQALFPSDAELIGNAHGTAYGCYLHAKGADIFMLPGPPKENIPMFTQFVIPKLKEKHYFYQQAILSWITLGLTEGEVSKELTELLGPRADLGYRWDYPFIEIKCRPQTGEDPAALEAQLDQYLRGHIISKQKKLPHELLQETLSHWPNGKIALVDPVTNGAFLRQSAQTHFDTITDQTPTNPQAFLFKTNSSLDIHAIQRYEGTITFHCEGYHNNTRIFQHEITALLRDADIYLFAHAYFNWQLQEFLAQPIAPLTVLLR